MCADFTLPLQLPVPFLFPGILFVLLLRFWLLQNISEISCVMIAAAMATGADTQMLVVHSSISDGCLSVVDGFRCCSPHCGTSADCSRRMGAS